MVWLPNEKNEIPIAMSIAGSDSVAGAGIQADIRTFIAHGVYPVTVITVVTAQNTKDIQEIFPLPNEIVEKQLDSLLTDVKIRATKIGVVFNVEIAETIYNKLKNENFPIVLDPIIRSQTGYLLIENWAYIDFMKKKLFSIADVVTPNISEAEILSGMKITTLNDAVTAAEEISNFGVETVIIKGGTFGSNKMIDVVYHKGKVAIMKLDKIQDKAIHGAGCTFSSSLTANLALGFDIFKAIERTKKFVWGAIDNSLNVGRGLEVVNQMYLIYKETEKERIRKDLWEAFLELKRIEGVSDLIPETRMNFVYALPKPRELLDIAGFPGRISVVDNELVAYTKPEFGASRHMARVVIEANKIDPKIKSAINLRFSEEFIKKAKKSGFKVVEISREEEPPSIRDIEGKSMGWIIKKAVAKYRVIPDIIYDLGAKGKEPMVRILGKDPFEVVQKIKRILQEKSY